MSIPAIPAGAWIALNAEVDTGLAPVGSFVRALPDDSLAVSVHVSEGKVVKPGVVQMTFSNLASHPSRPVEITMRFLPIEKRRTLPEVTIDDLSEVKFS